MIHSFDVLTTLLAQRVVCISTATASVVIYPAAASDLPIGITLDTVLDTTMAIPVAGPGERAKLFFNDTCTAGGLVGADSSGRGVQRVPGAATTTAFTVTVGIVGVNVGAAVAATGTISEVYIMPSIIRGT
jgi:hypothetical protein